VVALLEIQTAINDMHKETTAILIIKLIPLLIIKSDPIKGPVASPIFEINPARAAICPWISKVAHRPSMYGMVKPQAIPVNVLAIKYIDTLSE
jgi:hypothetical protein